MKRQDYKKEPFSLLIINAQKDNPKAIEELIRRIQKQIYTIYSHLVDNRNDISDLTQEALIRIAKHLKTLKDTNKFKIWMNQIVTNVFFDYCKKKSKYNVDFDNNKLTKIKDKIGCSPGEKCLFSEIEDIINAALMGLPKNLRISLVLREYEGLSYQEIAEITKTALGTVKSRISRAREKLQQELKDFI